TAANAGNSPAGLPAPLPPTAAAAIASAAASPLPPKASQSKSPPPVASTAAASGGAARRMSKDSEKDDFEFVYEESTFDSYDFNQLKSSKDKRSAAAPSINLPLQRTDS